MPRAFAWYVLHCMSVGFATVDASDLFSAEAVAGMIAGDILGTGWEVPEWLPKHYLTAKH